MVESERLSSSALKVLGEEAPVVFFADARWWGACFFFSLVSSAEASVGVFSSIGKKYKIDNFYLGCFFIRRLQTESAASGFFSTTAPFLAVLRPTPSFHSGRQFSGKMIWLSKSAVMPRSEEHTSELQS